MSAICKRLIRCRMLFLAAMLLLPALSYGQLSGVISDVSGGHATWPIAVTAFGGGATPIDKVVMNDLVLSGLFRPIANTAFIADADRLDKAKGAVQFPEWQRIGALYLLKGEATVDGGKLVVKIMLYDTSGAGNFIFGREYNKIFSASDARRQAHRIADDILERITGEKGVAGTQICYVRNNDAYGNSKQVCVVDADGANSHTVIPGGSLVAAPCWGANGTEIYYTTWRDYNPDLEGVLLSSGRRWWISRFVNLNISPDWSEKQQLLALTLSKDGNSEIYTMNRRGLEVRRLTNNRAIDGQPCWSPDGSQIAFTSDRTGSKQIYIMDVSSQSVRRLTFNDSSDNDGASWAPGGTNKIAFMSRLNGTYQICTINPDGSGYQQLTNAGYRNEDPSWAPNGRLLVFTSNRSGENQLYTMYADGTNQHQITSGSPSHSARWSPYRP